MAILKLKIALVAVALAMPTAANSQAFGVQMGMPVSSYGGRPSQSGQDQVYRITVPQPNSEFEFYTAWATPQTGICKVTGFGKDHTNDAYGSRTKATFAKLRSALRERYGRSLDYDFIKSGAVWDGAHEWNWSMYKKERFLSSFWDAEERSSLPANVNSILLDARAVKSSEAYVVVTYEFANINQCVAIINQRDASGL